MQLTPEDILYDDKDIIVCRKRPGIATQTSRLGEPDMLSILKNYLKSSYIGLVHRLDQPVEGILVFGKTKEAAAELSIQNMGDAMSKKYYAVVMPEEMIKAEAVLVDFLVKNGRENTSRVADKGVKDARRSELSYKVVKTLQQEDGRRTALVRVQLKTGRHHQIRVQMANAGMPLLGDGKYGSEKSKCLSSDMGIKNVALCAYNLEFVHPKTGKKMSFMIEPSEKAFRMFLPINA